MPISSNTLARRCAAGRRWREKKRLSVAHGLRSILRHDPDKIMVGEILDPETAEIAAQSAHTGHLVVTTVQANNVFDVVGRFIHMGVAPYSFVSALNDELRELIMPHTSIRELQAAAMRAGTRSLGDAALAARCTLARRPWRKINCVTFVGG